MVKEKDPKLNQIVRKIKIINEEIKNEMKLNPNIINKKAFVDALHNNIRKFFQKYRD